MSQNLEKIDFIMREFIAEFNCDEALKMFSEKSAIKSFLDNIYIFNNYSYNNQLLIHLQKPDAKFVASFKTYKDLGYSVK